MAGLTGFHRTRFRHRNLQRARLCVSGLVAHVSYRPSRRSTICRSDIGGLPSSVIFPQVQQPRYVIQARNRGINVDVSV